MFFWLPGSHVFFLFFNNVLLEKIGLGRELVNTIYHHRNLLLKGVLQPPLLINQPMGKGHLCFPLSLHDAWICRLELGNVKKHKKNISDKRSSAIGGMIQDDSC